MQAEAEGDFLDTFLTWARRQPDLVAAVLTGSRARDDAPVDVYSDYDIELFTDEPARYEGVEWPSEIAELWVCLPQTSGGHPTRLCFFAGGVKADFTIVPAAVLEQMVGDRSLGDLWQRGYRVLLDRDGVTTRLPPAWQQARIKAPPSEDDYLHTHREFWFEAAHIPRYLMRDELWVVKFRDFTMKQDLLRMMEWHALAASPGADVWYIGTKAKTWTAPDVWDRLHDAFARFDAVDSWRALLATVSLFRHVSRQVADAFGFAYPREMDDAITTYILSFAREFENGSAPAPADPFG